MSKGKQGIYYQRGCPEECQGVLKVKLIGSGRNGFCNLPEGKKEKGKRLRSFREKENFLI